MSPERTPDEVLSEHVSVGGCCALCFESVLDNENQINYYRRAAFPCNAVTMARRAKQMESYAAELYDLAFAGVRSLQRHARSDEAAPFLMGMRVDRIGDAIGCAPVGVRCT